MLTAAAASLVLAACAQSGGPPSLTATEQASDGATASLGPAASKSDGKSDLVKATEYWGGEYAKKPNDPQTALNYARNLRAMGEKQQALAVLQQASVALGSNRAINGEYGRLALEFDQVSLAQKLLEQADDPTNPDWKIISARGTALAKQGKYSEAIPFYERALALSPNQASVLSNLALANAMEGNADKAEPLLRRAVAAGGHEAKVNQNLAMVLSLQGKYDEAKLISARDLSPDGASSNVDYMRQIVKLDAKPMARSVAAAGTPATNQPSWAPQVATAADPALKPAR